MFFASIFSNTIDLVFFVSIISGIVFIVCWFLVAKIVTVRKNKKYLERKQKREERLKNIEQVELKENDNNEEVNNTTVDEDAKEDVVLTPVIEDDDNTQDDNEEELELVEDAKEETEELTEDETKEDLEEDAKEELKSEEIVEEAKVEETSKEEVEESTEEQDNLEEANEETSNDDEAKEVEDKENESVEGNQQEDTVEDDNESTEDDNEDSVLESNEESKQPEDDNEDSVLEDTVLDNKVEETEEEQEKIIETEDASNDVEDDHEEETEDVKEDYSEEDIRPEAKPKKLKGVVPLKKGRTYNGKYEVFQVADGYSYRLKASNGEILVQSETFTSHDGAIKAIDAVKRNLETGDIKIFADKNGKFKFKLTSKNYRVLAISANYSVEKSAVRAAESFKKFALKADIVDIEVDDKESLTATPIEIKDVTEKDGGKFIYEKFNGIYSWALRATNGEILCQSDGYTSKNGVLYSIDTFKRNLESGNFKCVSGKDGGYSFRLYNQQGRVCAIGESYSSKQSAESAAQSVMAYYKNAKLVEEKEKNNK